MNAGHFALQFGDYEELHDDFSLSGPLPSVDRAECPKHFIESDLAQLHYREYRSPEASANIVTYHAMHRSGDIAGFVSFRAQREDGVGSSRIFISVEHVYVMRKFRMRGLSRLLLSPLLKEVQTQLQQMKRSSSPKVYLHSTSESESPLGKRTLRKFEEELQLMARRCVGVELIGRYVEDPPGARQRLWETHLARSLAQ
ncbi:GNAT family N-acetyltransferase [Lysobacter sp. A378]